MSSAAGSATRSGVILQMGFPGYFLVVADFIKNTWAEEDGTSGGPC